MMVSSQLRALVESKVQECRSKIQQQYNVSLPPFSIAYDIDSARLGGEANVTKDSLRFNPVFLKFYTEHYVNNIVPHEVAHLGVHHVYDRSSSATFTQAHGREWKRMMAVLGVDSARCHEYEVPAGIKLGKPKPKFVYTCSLCQLDVVCGPNIHQRIQTGIRYSHASCGQRSVLIYKASAGAVTKKQAIHSISKRRKKTSSLTKKAEAVKIISMNPHLSRSELINMLVTQANLTIAGARTYYASIKKELEIH